MNHQVCTYIYINNNNNKYGIIIIIIVIIIIMVIIIIIMVIIIIIIIIIHAFQFCRYLWVARAHITPEENRNFSGKTVRN